MNKKLKGDNKQYGIRNYNFKKIKEDKETKQLYFNIDDAQKSYDGIYFYNAENIFFELLYRLVGREYIDGQHNDLPEIFTLKASCIDSMDKQLKEEYLNYYKRAIKDNGKATLF